MIRTAAYGRTGAAVTGGPHYETGAEPLIHGSTRGETLNTLWAMARLLDLSRRSHARDGWQSGTVPPVPRVITDEPGAWGMAEYPTPAPDTHLDDTGD